MQHRFTRLPALLGCVLMASAGANARDALMARGNAQITLSISPVNLYGNGMNSRMKRIDHDDFEYFDYTLRFSKPLSVTAEYALSNYTTVGLNVNYFSFDLSELRVDAVGVQIATTKGSHLDLHLRAVRYFYATPGSALYVLGEIGMRRRSIEYTGDKGAIAYINTFPETQMEDYNTLSYDYGIGFRVRIVKQLGVSAEVTMLSLPARFGIFYIIQPAGRRSKDQIGW